MLCSIDKMYIDDVRRILTMLCISRRPLTIRELIEAHTVDLSEPQHVDRKQSYCEDDVVDICLGLVEISHQDKYNQNISTARIAHFSVQEYLQSDRILQQKAATFAIQKGPANTEMAQICLVYLLDPVLSNGKLDETKLYDLSLARYAAEHWDLHYLDSDKRQRTIDPLVMRLFRNEGNSFFTWGLSYENARSGDSRWLIPKLQSSDFNIASPLHYAALLGLDSILDKLTSVDGGELIMVETADQSSRIHNSALAAAAYNGHVKAVQMLLERGAPAEQYDGALCEVSITGQKQIAQMLLDRGARFDVSTSVRFKVQSAFTNALLSGYEGVVELFLDRGAYADSNPDSFVDASKGGNSKVVQMLLDRGADVNPKKSSSAESALYAAAFYGHVKVVQTLLDNGVDINPCGTDKSPLGAAACRGRLEVMQLLLDRGANADVKTQYNESGLQSTATFGFVKAVQMLLNNGANVNIRWGKRRSPLEIASLSGQLEVVQMLLDRGAHIGSALQYASYGGCEKVVSLLLDQGADVNARGEITEYAPLSPGQGLQRLWDGMPKVLH